MSGVLPTFFIVAIALLLGGGGSSAPAPELAVQLLTALGFAVWAWQSAQRRDAGRVPVGVWVIGLIIVLIPLAQLVPLPPSVWHRLPGRDVEREALSLIGQADSWRSLSVIPGRTLASLLAMVAAVVAIPMVSTLRREHIGWLLAGIVCLALLSIVIGVFQMAGVAGMRFYMPDQVLPVGFQASRNFQAEVLNIGILCAGAASRVILGRRRMADKGVRVVAANVLCTVLMEAAQVLGASRTGLALSLVAMAGQGFFLWPALRDLARKRLVLGALAVGMLGLVGAFVAAGDAQNALSRFSEVDQTRPRLRQETLALGAQYAPVGAGMGTFLPLYEANERLSELSPIYIGRAHDDYLELWVETGWTGFVALAAVVVLWGWQVSRLWRSGSDTARTLCVFSVLSLVFIALHSVVDYPLRSMTLATLSAVMIGVVFCREAALNPVKGARYPFETKVRS